MIRYYWYRTFCRYTSQSTFLNNVYVGLMFWMFKTFLDQVSDDFMIYRVKQPMMRVYCYYDVRSH